MTETLNKPINKSVNKTMIDIQGVGKIFGSGDEQVVALDDINVSIAEGEFNVIIGPSGCGKSTLLYMLAGFEKPTSGQILLDGTVIEKPGPDRGFVFQDYALFPWKTVKGNIMFGLLQNGFKRAEAKEIAQKHIELVDLQGFENAFTHTLSGGMKQRVGIARALAYNPKVLLMDEPFGALDAQTRKNMHAELANIWQQTKKTVVFVTHDVVEAVYLADRVIVMSARPGQVKEIIDVNIPRPRSYTDDALLDIRNHILHLLES